MTVASWWRQHWRTGLALGVTIVGLIVTLILFALRKKHEADALRTQLALLNTSMVVAGLEADRAARTEELKQNAAEAKALDEAIAHAKREAVAVVVAVKEMSDEEVAAEFKRLGY